MKTKYLLLIAILVFLSASLAHAQTAGSGYEFNQNLTIGSTGSDVTALQQLLINKSFLTSVSTPTGYFGMGTQTALAKLQAANGISPASGYFGSKTRAFVNTLSVASVGQPTPVAGDQGGKPVAENNNQMCQNHYGANSDYTSTNSQGGLICGCESGYQWNSNQTACVAAETGYQVCSNDSSNATWNGTYLSNGSYDCVCDSGYVTNSAKTGCVAQSQASTQIASAIASYESELQAYENDVTADQNEIATIQTEASPSCSAWDNMSMSEVGGQQGVIALEKAQECNSYEQEISSIYSEINQLKQDETSAQNEIFYLESLPTAQ